MGPAISFLCDLYNQALTGALDALAGAGIETIRLDAFTTLNNMANSADEFGFSNVSDAYIFTGGDADEFLFWDAVHPTTRAHVVLASDATTALLKHFSPAQSSGTPAARVNGLNGLLRSASGN